MTLPLLDVTLLCDIVVRTETALTWLAKLSLLCDGRPADTTRASARSDSAHHLLPLRMAPGCRVLTLMSCAAWSRLHQPHIVPGLSRLVRLLAMDTPRAVPLGIRSACSRMLVGQPGCRHL